MKRILVVTVALAAVFGLLASCSDGPKLSVPTERTTPDLGAGVTIPTDITVPDLSLPDFSIPDLSIPNLSLPDVSLPTGFTIPAETIDLMIKQFEAAGMKVDRACFTALLSDASLRNLIEGDNGSPSPEIIQKFLACVS